MNYTYLADFDKRIDLISKYNNNALMLYTLEMKYDIQDITSVASEALTDGGDDKKCDLIYIDTSSGIAIIAQAYNKAAPQEGDLAPGNKASDLNTAAAWVFSEDLQIVPEKIREQVAHLQTCIEENAIGTIYFWYIHNLNEKNNPEIKKELDIMQAQARAAFKAKFTESSAEIFALEVGNETIEKWFLAKNKRISVTDSIEVNKYPGGYEFNASLWRAYVTAVSAKWLKVQYERYKDDLFSGNPRTYLGYGKKKNKINLGIRESIQYSPSNFWAFNNGITALVNGFEITEKPDGTEKLIINGITIINGAQTTGAISSVDEFDEAWVPIRFIVCTKDEIIDEIISNNNKQNEILASDLRSNDSTQNRLRNEFRQFDKYFYSGGRRSASRPTRSREVLDPYLVAQALLAFHGDCVTAYNSKTELWSDDRLYSSIFTDKLSAEHIIFTYSLLRAIENYKIELQKKSEARTDSEEKQYWFLSRRGSKFMLIFAMSKCMESIVDRRIINPWSLRFKIQDFDTMVNLWEKTIQAFLPMAYMHLEVALIDGLKNREVANTAANTAAGIFDGVKAYIRQQLSDFIESIDC